MPLERPRGRGTQLKPSTLLKLGPGLKPSQASFDHKLANSPEGEPEILDVLTKGGVERMIFHPSLGTLVSKVIAYDTKFLILCHAIIQFCMSFNLEYIDMVPTNIINNVKKSGPRIRMHSPTITKAMLGLVVERIDHIRIVRMENIHSLIRDSMLKVNIEGIELSSWSALHPHGQWPLSPSN